MTDMTRAEIEVFLEDLTYRHQPGVNTITQLLRQLDAANAPAERLCPIGIPPESHELCSAGSCDVCAASMRERLVAANARADAAAGQMRERCISAAKAAGTKKETNRVGDMYSPDGYEEIETEVDGLDDILEAIAALPLHEEPKT